ncbi:MAG: hypothetical protein OXN81_02425 [Alphaproteobacteria bacterium]|nr:hypothetical protein [Alphaproteobacteria bacterium]
MTPDAAHLPRTAAPAPPPVPDPGSRQPVPAPEPGGQAPDPGNTADAAQKHAIARAVWTDLLWLMPPNRTVTISVTGGDVAVELGPPADA